MLCKKICKMCKDKYTQEKLKNAKNDTSNSMQFPSIFVGIEAAATFERNHFLLCFDENWKNKIIDCHKAYNYAPNAEIAYIKTSSEPPTECTYRLEQLLKKDSKNGS